MSETDGQVISIIVPVYKVEPYLRKCLDSIANQTYHNLEIILVDDGSPDSCGAICDEYAAKDDRFKVIHKENGGLSSARNAGMAIATGEYIGFVDSDDWVAPDMFEYLLKGILEYSADIAICGRYEVSGERKISRDGEKTLVLDREQAMELLLKDGMVQNYCWDKLYRRELWEGIQFPEGRKFEDIAVMYLVFRRADLSVFLPQAKYYYLMRQNGISADRSLKSRMDRYINIRKRYLDMAEEWPQFEPLLAGQCVVAATTLWTAYFSNEKQTRQVFLPQLREMSRFCSAHLKEARETMTLGPVGRFVMRLTPYPTWWAFALAGMASKVYECKHGRPL